MSRESYVRGFCKAAAAAGVDPEALAKYAQQYKTEGYAPPMRNIVNLAATKGRAERVDIPYLNKGLGDIERQNLPELRFLDDGSSLTGNLDYNLAARMALNPKFKSWIDAHTNAAQKAIAPLKKIKYPDAVYFPNDIADMLSQAYHDEMKRTTSAPPVRVSAPAKK